MDWVCESMLVANLNTGCSFAIGQSGPCGVTWQLLGILNISFTFLVCKLINTGLKQWCYALKQPGFPQTSKHCFPGLAKTKFQGFPGLKDSLSRTFQDTLQIAENEMAPSLCKHSKGQRIFNNSIDISKIRIDPRGDKMYTMYYNEFLL